MKEASRKKQMGVSIKGWVLFLGFFHTSDGCCFSILAGLMPSRRQVPALNKKIQFFPIVF